MTNDFSNSNDLGDDRQRTGRSIDDEPPLNVSSESVSVSLNELINGVKRPLSKDSVDSDEIKKKKLTENDVNEKELGVSSSLNSKNDNENIDKNLDQMTGNNSGEHSSVHHVEDKAQNIDDDIIDKNKSTDVGDINNVNESSNTYIINNNCGPNISNIIINSIRSLCTSENGFVQGDQISNYDSSQLKMSSSENVDDEGDVDKISLPTTLSVNENCLLTEISEIRDVQLSYASNTHQSTTTENTNETIMMATVNDHNYIVEDVDDNDDNDCIFIESPSNSDIDDGELLINMAIIDQKKICKRNFSAFLKLFSRESLSYEAFESYCLQIFAAHSTTKSETGKLRYKIQQLTIKEKQLRRTCSVIKTKIIEMATIIKMQEDELKISGFAKPHIMTRTVGLQVSLSDPTSDSAMQLQKSITSSQQFNIEPIDISSDSDERDNGNDDIYTIDLLEYTEPLNSNCIKNKTKKKKQLPSSLPPSRAKHVPQAIPLLNVNNFTTTIDLTGPDDLNIPQTKLNVEKSPIKVIQCASHIGSSSLPPKGMTIIEMPQLPPSSSGFIMRTSSTGTIPLIASVSNSSTSNVITTPLTVSVANSSTSNVIKTPVSPFIYNNFKLLPVQLSPIIIQNQIQTSPIISHQSLQPVSPSVPIVLTHPVSLLPSLPVYNCDSKWEDLPPAPIIALSKSLDPQKPKELILTWNMDSISTMIGISKYQIYSYEEKSSVGLKDPWIKIGDIKALPLPMAASLTHCIDGGRYHFAVRAIDKYNRTGHFSLPQSLSL